MHYKQYHPSRELRPYIRSYFDVEVDPGVEFRFPSDGCPGLIINLRAPFLLGTAEQDLKVFTGCRLFGYLRRQLVIKSLSVTKALAVKFRPGSLATFFAVPGIELADTSVSIENLWGALGKDLFNRIYDSRSVPEIIKLLNTYFLKHLSLHVSNDRRIVSSLDEILCRKGQVRITDLADWTNLSRRQFERLFIKTIGLSPKRMCRIARISGIIPQLKAGLKHNWADIALASGYSDQAHFIREWKYFTGSSPQSYLRAILPFESAIVGIQ
jgi:AraC-like DNA-binding protein